MDIYGWKDACHPAGFFQGTLSGSRLLGFGSIGAETGDELLELFDLLLFLFVGLFHLLDQQLAGLKPEVVVSGIKLDLAIIDISSMCADLVQEITVMGYYDNRIVKIDQELLQPFDSRKIQVVGRLIKKKDIRISEKSLCKKNLDLHTTGKVCHLCIVELGVDAETV